MNVRKLLSMVAVVAAVMGAGATQTSTLVASRSKASADVTPGKWHAGFSKCKTYATQNKVPLIAVWSNGESCPHCTKFESAVNSTTFKNWMKESGCVFYFIYPGDGGDGKIGSTVFHWCRNNRNTNYPFVRIYWPAGKVDVATVGDTVDGNLSGAEGGKKAVAFFKKYLAKFNPVKTDPNLPYSIEFNANYPAGDGDANKAMDPIKTTYGTSVTLSANVFSCSNFAFAGWAKTATGTVAYKNSAAVKGLTSKSNTVISLYARWTRTTYGPYYTGIKKTIKISNYAGTLYANYKPASKIAGLTWSTKGYWTGTPTKAGTYSVKFTKGTSSITRKFIIVKDTVEVDGLEIGADNVATIDTSMKLDEAIGAVSGDLKPDTVKVTGLPAGLSLKDGAIVGRATVPGEYTVKITGTSVKNGQSLSKTFKLVVEEGDAILLNRQAHADEIWLFSGEERDYPLQAKVKHEDGTYELVDLDKASISCEGVDSVGFGNRALYVRFDEPGIYEATITATIDDRELTLPVTFYVLEEIKE